MLFNDFFLKLIIVYVYDILINIFWLSASLFLIQKKNDKSFIKIGIRFYLL